jgi:hypothetical protein
MSDKGTLRCQRCYHMAEQHSPTCALVSARVFYRWMMEMERSPK